MKHKLTNYGIQKLLENFTDERSFYLSMGYQITDMMYVKLESVKETLLKKIEFMDKARRRMLDEFIKDGKAVKVSSDESTGAYQAKIKEDYTKEASERLAKILNTEVTVDLEDFSIEEFEDVLGNKNTWRLSVPNRKFIDLLCSNK